jgi:hypothetical protein
MTDFGKNIGSDSMTYLGEKEFYFLCLVIGENEIGGQKKVTEKLLLRLLPRPSLWGTVLVSLSHHCDKLPDIIKGGGF